MSIFTYYNQENAKSASQELMLRSIKTYGFLPKLHAILAESPISYKAYLDTFAAFETSNLSPTEQQTVFMTTNYFNNCHYCVPGHSMIMTMMKIPSDIIEALREGHSLQDPKLEALRRYVELILQKRGHLTEKEIQDFLTAGYSKEQALDVLTGMAAKLISNFTNALAKTELDEPVKKFAWTHPEQR